MAPGTYRPYTDEALHRIERSQTEAPEPTKKDKKWSFGKLFRRKKKEDDSSTSENDDSTNSKISSKRKVKKKKRTPTITNFDHIVVRDTRRAQSVVKPKPRGFADFVDEGVLSDPSAGFINHRLRINPFDQGDSKEFTTSKDDLSSRKATLEMPSRKSRKGRLKARAEALRNSLRGDSSSDEESMKSSNSSSIIRFRSDDSLMRSRDSSVSKRSRSARNERYIKRLSRDDENQLNKEAELLQQGYTKAEVEMLTRTPTSQSSGYGTCRRDQANNVKPEHLYANEIIRRPMKSESISSFPSTQSYPSSINFSAKINNDHINYSVQYPSNNHVKEALYANTVKSAPYNNEADHVMCVKLPLGNVTNFGRDGRSPPVPPPRDMHKKIGSPILKYNEISKTNNQTYGVPNNDFERVIRRGQERTGLNGLRRPISNSEDHIAMQNMDFHRNAPFKNEQPRRPASVSAEPNHFGLYANTPPCRKNTKRPVPNYQEPLQPKQDFLYYADQSPRSRRPISIKTSQNNLEYLSDSQTSLSIQDNIHKKPRNASEFWRRLDDAERQKRQQHVFAINRSSSDFSNSYQNQRSPRYFDSDIQNRNIHKANSLSRDTTDCAQTWKAATEFKRALTVEPQSLLTSPTKGHTRNKSETYISSPLSNSDDEKTSDRRKSTNLDDALNELEAIYNSLGLGDEDLLDRAERRELMTPKQHFGDWNGNNDEMLLQSQPTTPLKRIPRRSTLPDKLQDDMAFRRLHSKERQTTPTRDTQSQISYMLASPVYIPYNSDDDRYSDKNEPDIVYDDVVYRNIKQANNRLKVMDPQPPFGIPVGPVTPAPQSDYLHATPDNRGRPRFIPRRSPDLVSDDLAYRSLRKDGTRNSSIYGPDFSHASNNNINSEYVNGRDSPASYKKKRAVRSLSANIFTMIQKEIDDALNMSKIATIQKTKSNGDVTTRLRESFGKNDSETTHSPRNKVKHRHNTVNLYVNNNTHTTPSYHFAKDDSFIHQDDKHLCKPPSCEKSKSTSPSGRSPQMPKRSSKDEFQHVLTMLAQEAMDTSNKLGVALAELDRNRNAEKKPDIQNKISDSRAIFLNELTNKSGYKNISTDSKTTIYDSDIIKKMLINPVQENQTKIKNTEDSLITISNQLHKVEDKLKHNLEKEHETSNATKPNIHKHILENKDVPDVIQIPSISKTSDNFVCNRAYASQDNNPLDKNRQHSNNAEINAFKELKDGITDLIAGISHVNEKLLVPKQSSLTKNIEPQTKPKGITEISERFDQVNKTDNKVTPLKRGSVNLSIYEDDLEMKKEATDSTEYNSSEELATIFRTESSLSKPTILREANLAENSIRTELSSPKLVQTVNQNLRKVSTDNTDGNSTSQNNVPTNIVSWRTKRQNETNSQRSDRGRWITLMHVRVSL